jgi:nitrous oxide reductase accessory protein NosL
VCGTAVAKHPGWIAQLVYDDGVALFFDGAKDLFRFLLSPRRTASDPSQVPVVGIFVTSYSTGTFIDARRAFFVVGSDVRGPTGEELVAHGSAAEAQRFSKRHSGSRVIGFDQVDLALLTELS